MPIQTDLNVAPYYDDYQETKDFYKILFRPGVAVQARELNQLQTLLQKQIERFGDNIFKRGTVVSGCSLNFHDALPYVKLKDTQADGQPVNVASYEGLFIRNTANLSALIVKSVAGFESRAPDLSTLYISYINSGDTFDVSTFDVDQVLTIYDPADPVFKVNIIDGQSQFSNSDVVVFVSAIEVQNSTGGTQFANAIAVGDVIDNSKGASLVVTGVDTTSNTECVVLRVRPVYTDLQLLDNAKWTFGVGDILQDSNDGRTPATIAGFVGTGAEASLVTDSQGQVETVTVLNRGSGYYVPPFVTIASEADTDKLENLNLQAQQFLAQVTVPSSIESIGNGYGLTVGEGVIYQKGYFSRVAEQLAIVEKYGNASSPDPVPDQKVVGFDTRESIVTSAQDLSLLDNAYGTYNSTAPGANRLKLSPFLVVLDKSQAEANTDFLPIVEFSAGRPYKQNRQTQYDILGKELARRTFEESGNYVLDQFTMNIRSARDFADEPSQFLIVVDPGKAYINGSRVETIANYYQSVDKGTDSVTVNNATISMNYGDYIRVNELAGMFKFSIGDKISLYDTAQGYITNNFDSTITEPVSGKIGEARIRSLIHESGVPGTPDAVYRLYLFDINMAASAVANFKNVKSVYYETPPNPYAGEQYTAIADSVLTLDPTTDTYVTRLFNNNDTSLVFFSGADAIKSISNVSYQYKTVKDTDFLANTGIYTTSVSGGIFPYTPGLELSTSTKYDFDFVPLSNTQAFANVTGTVAISDDGTVITGTTTAFITDLKVGDYVKIQESYSNTLTTVLNSNTTATIASNTATNGLTGTKLVTGTGIPVNTTATFSSNDTHTTVTLSQAATVSSSQSLVYGGANTIVQIAGIANNTYATTRNAAALPYASVTGASLRLYYPKNVPISLARANVSCPTATTLEIDFGHTLTNSVQVALAHNVTAINAGPVTKTVRRNRFVRLRLANNAALDTGPWCLGVPDVLRLRKVYTGSNTSFTAAQVDELGADVRDVTNDFYIDHNQNENYYGTSYLYIKPRSTIDLSKVADAPNSVLLVEFDVLENTADGVKTLSSYPIDDTKTFANLQGSMNTLEIPELFDLKSNYYDLRDCVDFRPVVKANSAVLNATTADSTTPVNPVEFDYDSRFSYIEKKFPLPDSALTCDIEYYRGRSDRVVVDEGGDIRVIKGATGSLEPPEQPVNALTLQILNIPPYPSVPPIPGSELVKIADTRVANEKYLNKRFTKYSITTPITIDQTAQLQPRGYTMAEIGDLERRIRELEYYMIMSLSEQQVKSRVIPSAIDASIDRFKFGFIVDTFSDYTYSDTSNPEYYATIRDGMLQPKIEEINVEFDFNKAISGTAALVTGDALTLPYVEYPIISQLTSTDGAVEVPVPVEDPLPTPEDPTPQVVLPPVEVAAEQPQTITDVVYDSKTPTFAVDKSIYEEFEFFLSSKSGPCQLYFNFRRIRCSIDIYYGQTPGFSTAGMSPALSLENLTVRSVPLNDPYSRDLDILEDAVLETSTINGYQTWLNAGRVSWTHDPADGRYVKIRITKHQTSGITPRFRFRFIYPTDSGRSQAVVAINPKRFRYFGRVINQYPYNFKTHFTYGWSGNEWEWLPRHTNFISGDQSFEIIVSGLKPNTKHKFFFDNVDQTDKAQQLGRALVDPIISDESGVIKLKYYYTPSDITDVTSDFAQASKTSAAIATVKSFEVKSDDATSTATGVIDVKEVVKEAINTNDNTVADASKILETLYKANKPEINRINKFVGINREDLRDSLQRWQTQKR